MTRKSPRRQQAAPAAAAESHAASRPDVSPLDRVKENEFLHLPLAEVGLIFGFGRNVMTALAAAGAPIIGKKCNPWLLREWLRDHHSEVGKIRSE